MSTVIVNSGVIHLAGVAVPNFDTGQDVRSVDAQSPTHVLRYCLIPASVDAEAKNRIRARNVRIRQTEAIARTGSVPVVYSFRCGSCELTLLCRLERATQNIDVVRTLGVKTV